MLEVNPCNNYLKVEYNTPRTFQFPPSSLTALYFRKAVILQSLTLTFMKKILYSALVAVAIASFGVHSGLAHAQTAQTNSSPSAAVLQQELDVAKATLINLEMKAGMVPAGDA